MADEASLQTGCTVDKDSNSESLPQCPMIQEARATKFLRVACDSTLEQAVSSIGITDLEEQYKDILDLSPSVIAKLHHTLVNVIKDQVKTSIESLIKEENLDKKFKELEKRSAEKKDCQYMKTPAWRPTGLTPMVQLEGHDKKQKLSIHAELQKLVTEKEVYVTKLMAQVKRIRHKNEKLEQTVTRLDQLIKIESENNDRSIKETNLPEEEFWQPPSS